MTLVPKQVLGLGSNPERLYILDVDKHIHIWDTEKGRLVKDVPLDKAIREVSPATQVHVSPGETYLMLFEASRYNGFSWDLKRNFVNPPPILQREYFSTDTRCVAYTPDNRFGTACAGKYILTWDVKSGKEFQILNTAIYPRWVGLVPEANAVVALDYSRLTAWNFRNTKEIFDVEPHASSFRSIIAAVMPKSTGVVTVADRNLKVWDLAAGNRAAEFRLQEDGMAISVSLDGRFLITTNTDSNKIHLYGLPNLGVAKKP